MARVRVNGFAVSLEGYRAGPHQDINNPLGVGGTDLHEWLFPTRTFQRSLFGKDDGTTGVDDDFAARGFANVGVGFLEGTCSHPIEATGRTRTGKVGGETVHRTTLQCSS